ncbi:MAG: nickel pincer cofactor biosynthesis protein LarB [Anaerolineae bacterium]|nr:nickel pincer cofactor biosynthesis protein LarB [Anaerolineae bacterium]
MDSEQLRALLRAVAAGETGIDAAVTQLRALETEDLGYARLDHHRAMRVGTPEVVYAPGKTPEQVAEIMARLAARGLAMATRAEPEVYAAVCAALPDARYDATARVIWVGEMPTPRGAPLVIASGGTADMPVAEEAALTGALFGLDVHRLYDVGVAGVHRLLAHVETLQRAGVVIAVAGMEGALPSVIGGLVACPVVAVPTSRGYGANFGGLSALLAMLNSCAPGVAVVNIDNGFGAAVVARRILRQENP